MNTFQFDFKSRKRATQEYPKDVNSFIYKRPKLEQFKDVGVQCDMKCSDDENEIMKLKSELENCKRKLNLVTKCSTTLITPTQVEEYLKENGGTTAQIRNIMNPGSQFRNYSDEDICTGLVLKSIRNDK